MTATPSITTFITYPGSAGEPSLLDVTIKSTSIINPQYPSGGTIYDAWCLIEHIDLPVPATYAAFLYSSYELGALVQSVPTLAGSKMLANLDNINWLLNYYDGANAAYGDVQGAIWKMMGSTVIVDYVGPQSQAKIDALVAMAMANDGYVPQAGEKIGVILDPMQGSTHRQPLIMEMKAAAIGDYVWHDANADGRQDSSETGIAGATVKLVRDQNLDGDFNDANEVIATTTTDAAGAYSFKGLTPGLHYQVQFSLPAGYDAVSPRLVDGHLSGSNSDAMLSNLLLLAPGDNLTTIDAGFYKQASLGDRLWHDTNGNGQQDNGEAGIAGAQVTLISGGRDGLIATTADNTSTTATTGADGAYAFINLKPGTEYQVQFGKPAGTSFTRADSGPDATDSDVNGSGLSQIIKLASGENNRTIDAGVVNPASLGDRVWLDANGNGQQDSFEAGIDGVTVTLTGGGADGLLATTGDNTSATVTTQAGGAYAFTNLVAGTEYQVQFAAPAGTFFTGQDLGADGSDSDAAANGQTQIIKLASGENNLTIDAGVYAPASIGDRVWVDTNANGQQDTGEAGIVGATVTLTGGGADGLLATTADNTSATTTTGADGSYQFNGLAPGQYQVEFSKPDGAVFTAKDVGNDASDSDADAAGKSQVVTLVSGQQVDTIDAGVYLPASLGDRVWIDNNANGQQDDGEIGAAGVTVTLTGGGADGKLSTKLDNTTISTTTAADGSYKFDNLTPDVEYQVQFGKPAGASFTGQDKGPDASDSDAGAGGLSQVIKLVSGEYNSTIDAGIYLPASLGDRVWLDANGNGQQDAGETGVAGATVTLIGGGADGLIATAQDNTSVTATTGADGSYLFDNLTPGTEYQVQFGKPAGTVFSPQDNGDDAADSDAGSTGLSQIVKLNSGETNTSIDAGVYAPASLGDRLWLDANGNGQQDAGEAGVVGATVTLIGGGADGLIATAADNTSVTTTTGADGAYAFTGLTPGVQYQVQFAAPAGSVFTGQDQGSDASDSDVGAAGLSQIVTLVSGEDNRSIDAGVHAPASLGDRVWMDTNGNGQQDAGEAGAAGLTVTLVGGGADGLIATTLDNTSSTTVTSATGAYSFTNLAPGVEYQVAFTKPADAVFSAQDAADDASDSDAGSSGLSQVVKLVSGETNNTIDAGLFVPASLGDRVWVDANGNGQQDAGEAGLAGAAVTLIGGGKDGLIATAADNTTVSTTTDADGAYNFSGLTPGVEYQVQFTKPADAVFTGKDIGSDATDSDAGANGLSQVVKLASGETNKTIDAGVYVAAALGDRLWADANGNGQQDTGEAGVVGATVTLIGGGADGLVATTADNTSATTVTGADGAYLFSNLKPGMEYQVQFAAPAGSVFTGQDKGSDASDSDVNAAGLTQVVKLASGETNRTIDAGVYVAASLGDRLWVDTNANGQQDDGATGIAGVTVTLIGGGLDGLVATTADNTSATTTTGADGAYAFTNLTPGMEYQVKFAAPAGTVFTAQNVGLDASDSDASANGLSQIVTLASGENNRTIDAGVYAPASLGDRVWIDANGNGVQDTGEAGAVGLAVTLIGGGADGLIATAGDNTSTSTVTGVDGAYNFANLAPGVEYQVEFSKPADSLFTGKDAGSNDAADSDADAGGRSQIVKLASGEANTSIDAGLFVPASLGDRVWVDANGNGQQDAGEAGLAGATVSLIGGGKDGLIATAADNTTVSTTTDADGAYNFSGLTPGMEYQVQFTKPADAVFTGKDIGNDATDSDAAASGLSQIVKLASGETNKTIDAGVYVAAALGDRLWADANGNGQQDTGEAGVVGATVTLIGGGADGLVATTADNTSATTTTGADGAYLFSNLKPGMEYQVQFASPAGSVFTSQDKGSDASDSDVNAAGLSQVVKLASGETNRTIDAGVYVAASLGDRLWVDTNANGQQDTGEAGVVGATVTLIGGGLDGLIATTTDNTSATTTTGADGAYAFTNLTPGMEYQVKFAAPAGTVFTAQNVGLDASDSDVSANGLSQIVTLASGENNRTIDAGVYTPASLGDRVWLDANGNGQQDTGEAGAAGLTVTLIGGGIDGLISTTGDNTSVTTTTAADGTYNFAGLTPGMEYQVQFAKPADAVFTRANTGLDATDSDASASGLSQIVKLVSGESNRTIDAGIYVPASIGDRLWVDTNGNGQQDDGATGIAGATVTLIGGGADGLISTAADNTSATTVTGTDGAYLFANLTPGMQYQVQFAKPADMVFTKQNVGLDASDSDVDTATGKSQIVTLTSGEKNNTIDAGVYATASAGDRLWIDTNGNGQQDDGATGLAGRTVTLLGGGADGLLATGADNTSLSMVTGTDGAYNFTNLTPGVQYQVQFSKPSGYLYSSSNTGDDLSDSDAGATTGTTQIVVLKSGESNKSLDAGLVNVTGDLSITKTDGLFSVSPGQVITYTIVVKNTGTALATDALVADVIPGSLTNVTWTSAASAGATGNLTSGSGSISDYVTLTGGSSITYTVTAKVAHMTTLEKVADFGLLANNTNLGQNTTVNGIRADAAFVSNGMLYGADLIERNVGADKGLGVLSYGEVAGSGESNELSAQKNAEVIRLTKGAGEQWTSLWVASLDAAGSAGADAGTLYWSNSATPDLATLTTKFTFKNGDFGVGADAGDLLTLRPAGFDANAQYVFFVASGASSDFVVWKAGTIPTQVVNTASVTAGGTFVDTNHANNSATDTDSISIPLPAPIVRGSIGNLVWEDSNFNGIKDTGEAGVANVTVKLLDANNNVLGTTLTNSTGGYLFNNLNAGSYKIEVVEPSSYYVTKANIGTNDSIDSDIDTVYGRSGTITLSQGENDMNWDAGLYRKASIGDKVWRDVDHDDIQDVGEEGIVGIKVMLYTASGTLLATQTTNSTGNYKFTNLDPGSYYLKFDKSNVIFKTYDMDDWMWGSKNIGTNDAIDSDVIGDGVVKTGLTRTDVTTLTSGENDMSWDAAITPIAIDLNGDGVHTVARGASSATFDLLGTGKAIQSGWLSSGDGFLAIDVNGNGGIDSIAELFGGAAKGTGFAQLATFDTNGDGVVNAGDSGFASLRIWQDANGNHATDAGELLSLTEAGVLSLTVAHTDLPFLDAQGNLHIERSSATLANGQQTDMTDVYFAINASDAQGLNVQSVEQLLGDSAPAVAVPLVGVQVTALEVAALTM